MRANAAAHAVHDDPTLTAGDPDQHVALQIMQMGQPPWRPLSELDKRLAAYVALVARGCLVHPGRAEEGGFLAHAQDLSAVILLHPRILARNQVRCRLAN